MKKLLFKDTMNVTRAMDFAFDFKDLSETGTFSGYASIFGNVDLGGDIVERGAFEEVAKTKDGQVRILLQHDIRKPIGKASIVQDDHGLKFNGSLVLANADARSAHELMKQGILDGMSIGYDILPDGSKMKESGVRSLTRLKLWEISVVTFGMNPLAKIETVKQRVAQCTTIREFEDLLRDVGGFSNRQAKLLACGGWTALQQARDESGDDEQAAKDMLKGLKDFTDNL
jgi:HK97 family phage prohead protease